MQRDRLTQEQLTRLQKEYRRAWTNLLTAVDALDAATDTDSQRAAQLRVEQAGDAYRIARNQLAGFLLDTKIEERELAGCQAA